MNSKATNFLVFVNGSIENAEVCFIVYLKRENSFHL
jgi:hypothetical protein